MVLLKKKRHISCIESCVCISCMVQYTVYHYISCIPALLKVSSHPNIPKEERVQEAQKDQWQISGPHIRHPAGEALLLARRCKAKIANVAEIQQVEVQKQMRVHTDQ